MKGLLWKITLALIVFGPPASAQTNDPLRQGIERLTTTFAEHFNKQDAAGVASTYTKDGVVVTQASSSSGAVNSGTQALVQRYENLSKMGFNYIDSTIT
jgi:ketosteroid isomerase-like protein